MSRYYFSLIRCVPNPRTGEFINVGAVVGNPDEGDWSVREIGNERRLRSVAEPEDIAAVHDLIVQIGFRVDELATLAEVNDEGSLDLDWLKQLHHDHRNVVQLSVPSPIVADGAESAMDVIFERFMVDPARPSGTRVTKSRALSAILSSYRSAKIDSALIRRGVDIVVGDNVTTKLDFAVGNGRALQLSQGWSFQVGGVEDIGVQVKSWGYALSRLRQGEEARVLGNESGRSPSTSRVLADVDLEVVVVEPATTKQQRVFDEANEVFQQLGVTVRPLQDAAQVGARAAALVRDSTG